MSLFFESLSIIFCLMLFNLNGTTGIGFEHTRPSQLNYGRPPYKGGRYYQSDNSGWHLYQVPCWFYVRTSLAKSRPCQNWPSVPPNWPSATVKLDASSYSSYTRPISSYPRYVPAISSYSTYTPPMPSYSRYLPSSISYQHYVPPMPSYPQYVPPMPSYPQYVPPMPSYPQYVPPMPSYPQYLPPSSSFPKYHPNKLRSLTIDTSITGNSPYQAYPTYPNVWQPPASHQAYSQSFLSQNPSAISLPHQAAWISGASQSSWPSVIPPQPVLPQLPAVVPERPGIHPPAVMICCNIPMLQPLTKHLCPPPPSTSTRPKVIPTIRRPNYPSPAQQSSGSENQCPLNQLLELLNRIQGNGLKPRTSQSAESAEQRSEDEPTEPSKDKPAEQPVKDKSVEKPEKTKSTDATTNKKTDKISKDSIINVDKADKKD